MPQAHVTTKGQITLPKAIRDHLKVQSGDLVSFTVEPDGQVTVSAVNAPVSSLKGIVPARGEGPISLEAMEQALKRRKSSR